MKEAMAIIGCLIVVLAGVMLLHVDKAQAVAGTSVSSPTVSTYPETILTRNNNTWDFQFIAKNALNSGSVITVNYSADFKINNDEEHKHINFAANRIYGIPIVTVNGLAASSIVVSGQQLQIQIADGVSAGSVVKLSIIPEAVSNPVTGGTKNILLWTSSDSDPVSIPVTIESSTLTVVLSNQYEGARKVNYKLTFKTRETIDYERHLYPVLPYDLIESIPEIDPSKVYLNGTMVDSIINSEVFSVKPGFGTNISPGEIVTLEFTAEAGLSNPVFEEGDMPTKQIGIRFGNLIDWAEVNYTKDYIPPTGTVTVEGIPASNTIFSRSILLNLNATDVGSGVIAGYEVSDTDYFYGFDDRLEYKAQVPYLLPPGAGPKTIYVRFYDAAKNPSVTYQITVIYDDKLNLGSLTVKDENIANVALSPSFSDAHDVYDAVVGSSVNTVKINLTKTAAANILLDDPRATYTAVNSTNGEITFSNLGFGSNDLKIRVSAAEGNKDYHLIIFKEGPELQHSNNTTVINNGSIVVLGGKQWVLTDKTKRQLTLLQPYTECAGYDSSNCDWDGYGNSWGTESWYDGYKFDPLDEDSVAYYLNNEFLNNLEQENISNISVYPFDNTIYSTGTVPTRWSDEYRVKAKVGLLSIPQYQLLKGTGVLNRFLGSEWFLMNPAHAGSDFYIFSVDSEGSLVANWNSKEVHPVVYLKPGMVISGGSGNDVSPFTLTSSLSSNANIASIKLQSTDLGYSSTSNPPVFSLNVSNEIKNVALLVTMADSTASVFLDGMEQPSGGTAVVDLSNRTVNVTGLATGVTTVHVHGLAADNTSKNYDIKITRAAPVPNNNATLSSLNVGANAVTPDANKNLYASVINSVYTTTITNAVYESGAKITIKSSTGGDVYIGQPVNLNVGANVFTIVVTAPDGSTTLTYMLTITRASSGNPGGQDINQLLIADLNLLDSSTMLNGNTSASQITRNLSLPQYTSSGYSITWSTSDAATITTGGAVTRPGYTSSELFKAVTLSAKASTTVSNVTYSTEVPRTFDFKVLKDTIATLPGGTTIDFEGATFGPNANVSVAEVTPLNISGTGMVSAGKTLEFTLTGITIDPLKPVKISIPTNTNANRSKVGVFYYNPSTLTWEYQKTEIDTTGAASAKVTHFSTYGVFEANKVATPSMDSLYTNDTTKQVTLTTSTEGAAIYFTLDGSEPTTASSLYNSSNKPNLLPNQTLKAIAVKNGMITSDTVSFAGKARKTITNILNSILNKADQNSDNIFDQSDVRALLNQVEPVRGH
ncbi:cadherin-like beta sandwich domain-containing protein [Paenibacillus periandrae]|uniref:cadherin-like beta sandwich domain-containing protein n=1 Tax=Paenibacillus periandrae TaxID=1761741 RepID=UPI001F09B151|nr:cadherin-like beta sandwich domain-containing protein [Paenibacillus periandrae]